MLNFSQMITPHRFLISTLFMMGLAATTMAQEGLWRCSDGRLHFRSDAPLELIEATSDEMQGVIDPSGHSFAFAVAIRSFQGFNSELQREHFNENYLESHRFPKATFAGRIIEDVDLRHDGQYTIRAKGNLVVHGVERERIIKCAVKIQDGALQLEGNFTVLLVDHDIAIPRIVHQKIAQEIAVQVKATMQWVGEEP